jgi:hypothetical protein
MNKKILCLLVTGIVGFGGCSSSTKISKYDNFPVLTNDDYSTLYMFRESRLYGSGKADPIYLDGQYSFRLGNGDCVTFKIPTGQSEIVFVPEWKQVKFVSERGKKYFFYLRVEPGKAAADFRQITEEDWNEKQKACNWVHLERK